jgi:hypothetical protein
MAGLFLFGPPSFADAASPSARALRSNPAVLLALSLILGETLDHSLARFSDGGSPQAADGPGELEPECRMGQHHELHSGFEPDTELSPDREHSPSIQNGRESDVSV